MIVPSTICGDNCDGGPCRQTCSLEVVDKLLSTPLAISGDDVDLLLDFRSLLRARRDAEATLRLFCELRRRLEQYHYLDFYRLRRWLERQLVAQANSLSSGEQTQVLLRLDFYCVEAIRRQCLCTVLQSGDAQPPLRLSFSFAQQPHPLLQLIA